MRAPISVIIPTLNAEHSLPDCLHALMEGAEAGLISELIVSDGASTDLTPVVAQAWGAEVMQGGASRGGQLRRACAQAKADWLLVLHADTQLSPGWAKVVQTHMRTSDKAAWFHLRFDHGGLGAWVVSRWANLRSLVWSLPYGDQGLLISRAMYEAVGGYPDLPLMEDVALARRLKGQMTGVEAFATTSASKYRKQGWLCRGAKNLWTLARYFAGGDVASLARGYRR